MKIQLSSNRDIPLLQFLWLWKVSTFRALAKRFFSDSALKTAYHRIMKLQEAGLITAVSDRLGTKRAWTLTTKGFKVIRPDLPALKEEGFAAEHISHDLLVSAVQIGEFLVDQPKGVEFFSEQQLRRYDVSQYPAWVPKDFDRRPDGYWRIKAGQTSATIALEVEINSKPKIEYQQIITSYAFQSAIDDVLWVVESVWLANLIHRVADEFLGPGKANHSFILIDEFIKNGWNDRVFLGKRREQKIHDFFRAKGQECLGNASGTGLYRNFLSLQKSHKNSEPCKLFGLRDFT